MSTIEDGMIYAVSYESTECVILDLIHSLAVSCTCEHDHLQLNPEARWTLISQPLACLIGTGAEGRLEDIQ